MNHILVEFFDCYLKGQGASHLRGHNDEQILNSFIFYFFHIAIQIVCAIIMSNGRPFTSCTIEEVIDNGSLVQIQRGPATVIGR